MTDQCKGLPGGSTPLPEQMLICIGYTLQWHHNGHDGVSNHQPHHCLLNRLFGRRSKKTSNLCVTGLCVGNWPGTDEFPAQMASNAENISIWWRHHHDHCLYKTCIWRTSHEIVAFFYHVSFCRSCVTSYQWFTGHIHVRITSGVALGCMIAVIGKKNTFSQLNSVVSLVWKWVYFLLQFIEIGHLLTFPG